MDDTESLHDPDYFWFSGPVFVVAPFPRPTNNETTLRRLVRGVSETSDGKLGNYVCVFSDIDLAQRMITQLGEKGKSQKPLTFPTVDDFAAALVGLQMIGDTHIGIDPGGSHVRRIDIPRVIDAIRNRKRT